MKTPQRFQDQNYTLEFFYNEVWVICPSCEKKAIARANHQIKCARLVCADCGYNKEVSTAFGKHGTLQMEANAYFDASLWLQAPYKGEIFMAYNLDHLEYLENYIAANLRENKNRTHFTLLEKLPAFMQSSKNRTSLLKIIQNLKLK